MIAVTAEAAWSIVAVSTDAIKGRLGQAFIIICRGQRTGGATWGLGKMSGTMTLGLPPDQMYSFEQVTYPLSASVYPSVK